MNLYKINKLVHKVFSILLTVHIDGASRGNPGPSGIGVIIFRNNTSILNYGEFIGFRTNLLSEYLALKRALQLAVIIDNEIRVHTDSMTIVRQRKSKERIRKKELKILSREINNLEKKFRKISYEYIPRKRNASVDLVAKKAIDYYIN